MQGTFAWMVDSDSKKNTVEIKQYIHSQQLKEEFTPPSGTLEGGSVIEKKNWVFNDGDVASFVRVKVFPVLTTQDDMVHLEAQFGKQLYYVGLNETEWKNGGDGFFYYTKCLEPGASTEVLFEKIELDQDIVGYDDAVLTVTLLAETVETRQWHYREAWWGSTAEINSGTLGDIDVILRDLAQ